MPFFFPLQQLRVHRCLADTQKMFGLTAKHEASQNNIKVLEDEIGVDDESDEEEKDMEEEGEENDELLLESEMLLPDSGKYC